MKRANLTEKILDTRRANEWSWAYICEQIGSIKPLAKKATALFELSAAEERMLNEVPYRGTSMPPTDPLLYRFYEML
jgi:cyanate lyase